MLSANDLRNGTLFVWEDDPWKVLKYQHIFQGRGRGKVTVRARNLKNQSVREISFQASDTVEEADVVKKKLIFRYRTRQDLVFDDELTLPVEKSEWEAQFLTKGEEVWVLFYQDQPIGITLPPTVILAVKQTEPGFKGDSVSNILKPAVLSTGLSVKIPLFISQGEKIVVSTEVGEYRGRA
jgi:elongation factor P